MGVINADGQHVCSVGYPGAVAEACPCTKCSSLGCGIELLIGPLQVLECTVEHKLQLVLSRLIEFSLVPKSDPALARDTPEVLRQSNRTCLERIGLEFLLRQRSRQLVQTVDEIAEQADG